MHIARGEEKAVSPAENKFCHLIIKNIALSKKRIIDDEKGQVKRRINRVFDKETFVCSLFWW